jgi:peptidoglycan/LPS O-acetylase OafA/YrhL
MFISIQSGRGLAALAVAAFHLTITMGESRYGGQSVFGAFTSRGNLGVDFFFVLSGFIILFAHFNDIGQPYRIKSYFSKRFIRVYPIYLLYTLSFSFLLLIGFGTNSNLPTNWQGWITSLTLIRFDSVSPPIAPSWTLFHEVAFYILFVTLILNKKLGLLIFTAWAILILYHFQYAEVDNRTPYNVYFSLHNLNFYIGMFAFLVYRKATIIVCRWSLYLGALLFLSAVSLDSTLADFETPNFIYAISFGFILTGLVSLESNFDKISIPVAAIIGDASYTIYLLHLAIEGLLLKILFKLDIDYFIGRSGVYIITLILTILAGCMAYIYIERPLLNVLRSRAFGIRLTVRIA